MIPLLQIPFSDQAELEDMISAEIEPTLAIANVAATTMQSRSVVYRGQKMSKVKALGLHSKYRTVAGSTDRLRRVQAISRHFSVRSSDNQNISLTESVSTSNTSLLVIQDPVASLLRCDDRYWLCIGEVNGLKDDGESLDALEHSQLAESRASVSFSATRSPCNKLKLTILP